MRFVLVLLACSVLLLGATVQKPPTGIDPPTSIGVGPVLDYFRTEAPIFAASCAALRTTIGQIRPHDRLSVIKARQQLIECRLHYKRIEFLLEYFFHIPARVYNSPPKYEPEEPDMEYQHPEGMQVIESLLFEKDPAVKKKELMDQAEAVASSASDLPALIYGFQAADNQVLESLRLELIRVISLGITGYDASLLKTGIAESYEAIRSLSRQLEPYLAPGGLRSDSLHSFLEKTIDFLRTPKEDPGSAGRSLPTRTGKQSFPKKFPAVAAEAGLSFDAFDRLSFLTTCALPLQRQLSLFIAEKNWELNTHPVLNYQAAHLFSPDALIPENFPGATGSNKAEVIGLGKTLFSEPALSGNGKRSCATCHAPEKMFTDRLPASMAIDGHTPLKRNAPTLLYCAYQYQQFWDGRAATLEDQVRTVLHDPQEMSGHDSLITARLKGLTMDTIVRSIAAYVRSLHPMNSPFDRYMQGDDGALGNREIKGANLFMGKAQCATCHFMPLFNGLIPPGYQLTEYEVLGTTGTDDLSKPRLSKDQGRYTLYAFPFYKGAFKTPTVRNSAETYPYMHNGAFHNLETLMDFYNKGGGAGLGIRVPAQTLPAEPLHLSKEEIRDIICFLHSLTDRLPGPS